MMIKFHIHKFDAAWVAVHSLKHLCVMKMFGNATKGGASSSRNMNENKILILVYDHCRVTLSPHTQLGKYN